MKFLLYASIYENPEIAKKNEERDFALELKTHTFTHEIIADSIESAVLKFEKEYSSELDSLNGKTLYFREVSQKENRV